MRKALNDYSIIQENGVFHGISLGYDYCAEHEWGISALSKKLGIDKDSSKLGIEKRTITKNDCIKFFKDGNKAVLTTYEPWNKKENFELKDFLVGDLRYADEKTPLATSWSESDFCVFVSGEENVKFLEDLYEQFKKNNIAIAKLNISGQFFSNASLSLLIIDRLPKDAVENMYSVDKKGQDLIDYEKEIGLTELKAKTRGRHHEENYYMACSAKWINYDNPKDREKEKKKLGTKYDIRYWVNYSDDDNNFGWYSVEEIKKWLSTPGLKLMQIRDGKK